MQNQSNRTRLDSAVLLGSLGVLSFITGCAAGPPMGPLGFVVPPGLMIALLVVAVHSCSSYDNTCTDDSAASLLRVRYARGEIDREDFLQRRRDLEGKVPPEA